MSLRSIKHVEFTSIHKNADILRLSYKIIPRRPVWQFFIFVSISYWSGAPIENGILFACWNMNSRIKIISLVWFCDVIFNIVLSFSFVPILIKNSYVIRENISWDIDCKIDGWWAIVVTLSPILRSWFKAFAIQSSDLFHMLLINNTGTLSNLVSVRSLRNGIY